MSLKLYLLDVNKLEMLVKCTLSADVQRSVSILADSLCNILTLTASSTSLPGSQSMSFFFSYLIRDVPDSNF